MNRHRYALIGMTFLIAVSLLHPKSHATGRTESQAQTIASVSPYLFVWAGDKDSKDSDFLAVVDVRPGEATFGEVIATLPVGTKDTFPHHTEYEFPESSKLFLNGWGAGRTFIIDLESDALRMGGRGAKRSNQPNRSPQTESVASLLFRPLLAT